MDQTPEEAALNTGVTCSDQFHEKGEGRYWSCQDCVARIIAEERVKWGSKICSRHRIPEADCDICHSDLWGQWIVEYDENSIAWIVSVSHPDVRYPLAHGRSVADAIRSRK